MPALGVYRKRPVRPTRRQSRRGRWVAGKAAAGTIAATSPVATQFRRGGGSSATMAAAGTYANGTPGTIRYRLDNGGGYGAYQVCDAAPAGGTWSGSIVLPVSELDYTVEFSWGNDTSVTTTVAGLANLQVNIAYGGQSNEAGRGTSLQTARPVFGSATSRMKTATGFAVLADPTNTEGVNLGSYALHEANILGATLGRRVGIVNMSVGGTTLAQWQTFANGGSGNYEALRTAANAVGGLDILHAGPCETDAINGTTQAAYHAGMVTFEASWHTDFPNCKIVWRTLQHIDTGAASQPNQDAINAAILTAAGSTPGKATGDIAGIYLMEVRSVPAFPGDQFHWLTDQQLADVGGMAAAVDYAVLNPAGGGGGGLFVPRGFGGGYSG